RDLRSVIYSGTSEEWKQSNLVQDLLADNVLKFYGVKRNSKRARVYYLTNSDALKAFQRRKDDGLGLSERLWNQSKDYKEEMEHAISSAIEKGTSAVKLSKRLSKYLQDFTSLKHDYKEKFGKAVTCQDCEYRSIRLARSEINMAYRTAEQERWKQFDFVLGYEVKLTQNGHHVPDICDDLAGKYPKDFIFMGWHPNCMCYVVPILKTEEQFWNDEDVSEIVEPPKNFTDWLENNAERIDKAAENDTLPYWYEQNAQYVNTTRWENWRKLDDYDHRNYERVQKWKEGLGLDTSRLEKLLRTKDVEDWHISGELMDLTSRIEREKDRYREEWLKMYERIESDEVQHGYDKGFIRKLRDKLSSVSSGLAYDVKMSWEQLRSIGDLIEGYDKELVDVVIPSFRLKSAGFGTITKDLGRVRDQLNAFIGTARHDRYGFLDFRDHFDHMVTTGKVNDTIRMQFVEMLDRDEGAVWKCIDHLNELANATDLKKIQKRWYRAFNKYMEEIRAWDIETNGYAGVYTQIEGAYNIYKLSTMPEVAKYGIGKVNDKMPWNLFEVFKEKGIDYRYLPDASFFRQLDDFVPWYDGIRQNIDGDFNIYSSAHCSYRVGHVAINKAFFDQTNGRCAGNMYKVQDIFYHEYGHAIDYQRGLSSKKRITALFDKYAAKYDAMSEDELREKYWDAIFKIAQRKNPSASEWVIDSEIQEKGIAISDVIQAMRKDHIEIDGGHPNNYYLMKDKDGKIIIGKDGQPVQNRISQLAEFIAHMNEVYWYGNDVWRLFDEELYEEVRTLMRVAYRGKKDALNKVK
ncbi:MAG: hypothetical protein IJS97_06335, partial [Prevotella sp.]|nr:hypothetical protein [Prevotella sp.]